MESISKALAVIGTIGVACGIMGCIGLFAGGPFGDFMQGATPGIVIGAFRPSPYHPPQG